MPIYMTPRATSEGVDAHPVFITHKVFTLTLRKLLDAVLAKIQASNRGNQADLAEARADLLSSLRLLGMRIDALNTGPPADMAKKLEQAEHRAQRHAEHIGRLETRLAALERQSK